MINAQENAEMPQIKRDTTVLTNNHYNTPKTSLLIFHFEPQEFASSKLRLENSSIKQASIDGKDIYLIDDFFDQSEGKEMRNYAKASTFSRNSYGSPESIEKGEKPARTTNSQEAWKLISHPPEPLKEFYKLLGLLAFHMNADITTLPWELCTETSISPSVLGNLLEEASIESMKLGMHQDCNPQKGISFGIPMLYSQEKKIHDSSFSNGDVGKPLLISAMLYVTSEEFLPEYRMGTAFYKKEGELALRANCLNMRIVFFEGDILHTIEESKIPAGVKAWRISYVYKLIMNPRQKDQCLRTLLSKVLTNAGPQMGKLALGSQSRG